MSRKEMKKHLSKLKPDRQYTREELREIGLDDDTITRTPYLKYAGGDSGYDDNGMYSPQDGELFSISDDGLDLLEEYYYRDKPIFISMAALAISAIALLKSFSSEIITLLQWTLSMLKQILQAQ